MSWWGQTLKVPLVQPGWLMEGFTFSKGIQNPLERSLILARLVFTSTNKNNGVLLVFMLFIDRFIL